MRDLLHRDPAREFPRLCTAHSVAHREEEILPRPSTLPPSFPESGSPARRIAGTETYPRYSAAPARDPSARTNAGSGAPGRSQACPSAAILAVGEDRREFKIDQAKTAIGLPVGDIAHLRVVVADAVRQQLREEFPRPRLVEMFDPGAAVRGDDPQMLRFRREQSGHKVTPVSSRWRRTRTSFSKRSCAFGPRKVLNTLPSKEIRTVARSVSFTCCNHAPWRIRHGTLRCLGGATGNFRGAGFKRRQKMP